MFVRANFVDTHLQGMHDRSMRSGTELAREIKLTDWSIAGNLSNRSSGVQIPRDICTRIKRYLYSAKCSWIIDLSTRHSVGITTVWGVYSPEPHTEVYCVRLKFEISKLVYWRTKGVKFALLSWKLRSHVVKLINQTLPICGVGWDLLSSGILETNWWRFIRFIYFTLFT